MTNKSFLLAAIAIMLFFQGCREKNNNLIGYVTPLIGTGPSVQAQINDKGFWGQAIPAVSAPFAMTQWTPQIRESENPGTPPYYYTGTKIQGFRGSHWIGGPYGQDYGSFTIMPITGVLATFPSERSSDFKHESEISTPAYYSCMLDKYLIITEITGTTRSGFFKFSFLNKDEAYILVEPNSDTGQGYVRVDPERQEISGYNPVNQLNNKERPTGFCGYFVIRFNKPVTNFGCYFQMENLRGQKEIGGKPSIGAYVKFDIEENDVVLAKVGTSFTGIENARANLDAEIPHWEFGKTRAETEKIWNNTLSKIELKGNNSDDYTKFYTALYRSLLNPRTFSDVDGSYPAFDDKQSMMKTEKGHVYYDDFVSSDMMFGPQLPLIALIAPDRYEDMMKSIVLKAIKNDWLPTVPAVTNQSAVPGDHASIMLADAFIKGFDINIEKAYSYLRKNAFEIPVDYDAENGKGRQGMTSYLERGYVAALIDGSQDGNVSKQAEQTINYSLADFALSKVADKYSKHDDFQELTKRTANYKNVFSDQTKEICGRMADGSWISNNYFSKVLSNSTLWDATHDIPGLFGLIGSNEQVRERLDEFFNDNRYANGNGQQVPYLYNYLADPLATQHRVKDVLAKNYTIFDGGVPGIGSPEQASAWYVFSAMGFFPVTPATGEYQLSSPIFEKVKLSLDQKYYPGGKFTISLADTATYHAFDKAELNGSDIRFVIKHDDIKKGGNLKFSNNKIKR